MTDTELRSELLIRKDKLVRQVKELQGQIDACDALIASLPKQPNLLQELDKVLDRGVALATELTSLQACVEQAIANAPKEFSVRDVYPVVERLYTNGTKPNKDSISMAFWKAVNNKGYEIVTKGKGSRPTLYRKP